MNDRYVREQRANGKKPICFICMNSINSYGRKMSKFQPTGSKNCGISLPAYIVDHIDSIRCDLSRSKFVLGLIRKSLELNEAAIRKS